MLAARVIIHIKYKFNSKNKLMGGGVSLLVSFSAALVIF